MGLLRVLAALLVVFMAGLGSAQGLTIWTALEGETRQWLDREVASYEAAFRVPVEVVQVPLGELRDRALREAEAGTAADVFVGVPHTQVRELAQAALLLDVSAYATDEYLADLSVPARGAFTRGGALMGLPLWVEGPALIVNTELVPEVPEEYEEWLDLAVGLTDAGRFGFLFDYTNPYYAYTWIHSYGGYVFARSGSGQYLTDQVGLDGDGAVAGVEEMRRLRHDLDLLPAAAGFELAATLFLEGKLAMHYDGPWAAATYLNAGVPIRVLPLPPREGEGPWSGFMGSSGVLLNAFGGSRVAAVNLAKWLVREEAQAELARQAFRVPASLSAADSAGDPLIGGFSLALRDGVPLVDVPEMGRVWRPLGEALSLAMATPGGDVRAVMERAVEAILRD